MYRLTLAAKDEDSSSFGINERPIFMILTLPTSMHDWKVLSTPVMVRNGEIVSVDLLETSQIPE
ncbi:hypothetical protein [Desulfocastanea catecholica]